MKIIFFKKYIIIEKFSIKEYDICGVGTTIIDARQTACLGEIKTLLSSIEYKRSSISKYNNILKSQIFLDYDT